MEEILPLRKRINEIDDQILHFLKERVVICKGIGTIKRKHGIPIRDYRREDELYTRITQKASELGLDPSEVKAVYREIIAMSVHVQEDNTTKPPTQKSNPKINQSSKKFCVK